MRRRHLSARLVAAAVAAMMVWSLSVAVTAAHDQRGHSGLLAALVSTARFNSVRQAGKAGYALPDAPAPLHECISSFDGTGAMGFHYINGGLLDTTVDATRPEALVYAPDRHGHLRLAALEYVVFQAPWIAEHGQTMPRLFGQMFMATGNDNRFQIPAFFSLHVWLWKPNPAGLFAPFNPTVSCSPARGGRDLDKGRDASGTVGVRAAAARFDCGVPQRRGSQA